SRQEVFSFKAPVGIIRSCRLPCINWRIGRQIMCNQSCARKQPSPAHRSYYSIKMNAFRPHLQGTSRLPFYHVPVIIRGNESSPCIFYHSRQRGFPRQLVWFTLDDQPPILLYGSFFYVRGIGGHDDIGFDPRLGSSPSQGRRMIAT